MALVDNSVVGVRVVHVLGKCWRVLGGKADVVQFEFQQLLDAQTYLQAGKGHL